MGLKVAFNLNIPGVYLIIIAVFLIISSFLFLPWSPINKLLSVETDEWISPDNCDLSYMNETFDGDIETGTTLGDGSFVATWSFDDEVSITAMRIRAEDNIAVDSMKVDDEACTPPVMSWDSGVEDIEVEFIEEFTSVTLGFSVGTTAVIYEIEFEGVPFTCYTCQQTPESSELVSDTYYGGCPTNWYLEENLPDGYCFDDTTPIERLGTFCWTSAILLVLGVAMLILALKRF